jgi:DNA repair protein RecO (recombination protein O)
MAARVSETFVLRTYPFREGDLIVSFFTRDLGKLRGVARRARRPKSPFGSGLERLSQVRMTYYQRETAELATLTGCELIQSQFDLGSDYGRGLALDFFTETAEHLLPAQEPNEKFFRLMMASLAFLRSGVKRTAEGVVRDQRDGDTWATILYFALWTVKLAGILPEMRLKSESVEIAEEMLQKPLAALTPRAWSKGTAADLRRALVKSMEQHVERKFLTVPLLEAL